MTVSPSNSILECISGKIHYKANDILPIHLLTCLRWDSGKYYGQTNSNGFVIWRYSRWSGIFYPVVTGTLVSENSKDFELKTHMNSAGALLLVIVFAAFFFAFPIHSWHIVSILFRFVFASLPILASYLGYSFERKQRLAEISMLISEPG